MPQICQMNTVGQLHTALCQAAKNGSLRLDLIVFCNPTIPIGPVIHLCKKDINVIKKGTKTQSAGLNEV